ncbi:MAG: polysaccharide deacetylase family protein [Deltaproteobacteria bacterium]|nr:polysaccharide deacetylase family protein [Deltaproteobacteria bacterium]
MWIDPLSRRLLKGAGLVPASKGRGPVILMYHSIESEGKKPLTIWDVTAKNFKKQMRLLKEKGWKTARVSDLVHAETLPPRTVVLTLDDGYADNFEHGFGVVFEYGMRATWFIVTQDVGKQSSWPDPGEPVRSMLNKQQIRQMAEAGMEIASHTRTHPRLPELDALRMWEEVSSSKKELEELLGRPVVSFAYPYGSFNEDCVVIVKKAGYQVACTARPGWFGSEKDLLRIRRVPVFSHDTLSSFARKLAFAYTNVGWDRMMSYAMERIKSRLFRV